MGRNVLILAPVVPMPANDGYKLAIESDISAFRDSGFKVRLFAYRYDYETRTRLPGHITSVNAKRGGFAPRLARSLITGRAPSIDRLYTWKAETELTRLLSSLRPDIAVVDDLSLAGWIPLLRNHGVPKIIFRSHNVMNDVREAQIAKTKSYRRWAVSLDLRRIRRLERHTLAECDAHWAISQADSTRMAELYQSGAGRVLPVSLDLDHYERIPIEEGDVRNYLHVGTIDHRREQDFQEFLKSVWPRLQGLTTENTLVIAGRVPKSVEKEPGLRLLGVVSDDAVAYRMGKIALNFQRSTGGVKIKSLTALAAGRTLASTPEGVEGLSLQRGVHYLDLDDLASRTVTPGMDELRNIAKSGREWVRRHHSREFVTQRLHALTGALA